MHETLTSPSAPSRTAPDVLPADLATIAVVTGSAVQSAANALSEMALREITAVAPSVRMVELSHLTMVAGDRFLAKDQTTASENGIYVWNGAAVAATRAADANTAAELEQAVTKFRQAINLQPESSEAQHDLGLALAKQGDVKGASGAFRKALELNPGDVFARQGLEKLNATVEGDDATKVAEFEDYIRRNQFKEVEPLLTDYVTGRPKSSWGWYALGYCQFAQQKIGQSIQSLAKSLQIDIRNAEAHKILGRDLMIVGRFDAAQVEFEQGIRYSPQSAEIHYDLGKLFSIQDNWESARKQFEEALRIDPSYVEGLDALGLALEALGDDASAVANYQKAIALNEARKGTFSSAHVNLSAYYNRTSEPEKALEYANKALELDPKSDRAWFQKGKANEGEGRLNDAVDSVNRAISFNSRASSYYYVLAGLYRRLGKMEDSRKALDSFTRLDKETSELDKMRRSANHPGATPTRPGDKHE